MWMKQYDWNQAVVIDDEIRALTSASAATDTMWKFEQLRAGQVYAQFMFNTLQDAQEFAAQMTKIEPDLFCRIEPVAAKAVWN
jgi:hypothetical protein